MTIDLDVDDFLAHYGVKGMHWGVVTRGPYRGGVSTVKPASTTSTASPQRKGLSEGQKKALKVGVGVAVVTGAVVVTGILAKNGNLPVSALKNNVAFQFAKNKAFPFVKQKAVETATEKTAEAVSSRVKFLNQDNPTRADAAKLIKQEVWDTPMKDFMQEIEEAHREQTKYMKTESSKSGISYDPARDN
jgi:cellobiose-specific phosphotransferase system component IIA